MKFQYYQPCRVHFGRRELDNVGNLSRAYGSRCLLVTTENVLPMKELFDRVKQLLKEAGMDQIYHYEGVVPNPTVESIEAAWHATKSYDVDVVLAVGGGSSIDTAKMIALTHSMQKIDWDYLFENLNRPFGPNVFSPMNTLPIIGVSTTAGTGSQVTQCAVVSVDCQKHGIFHNSLFPKESIVDPEVTASMPPRVTASSGFDAFCHCCESFLKPTSYSLSDLYAVRGMELAAEYLTRVLADPHNLELREKMSEADLMGGMALSNVGGYIVHPLGELIGSCNRMDHGQTLALILPHMLKMRWRENPVKFARVATILDPSLSELPTEEAAAQAGSAAADFIDRIGLKRDPDFFGITSEEKNKIFRNETLGNIAFIEKEDAEMLLNAVFREE